LSGVEVGWGTAEFAYRSPPPVHAFPGQLYNLSPAGYPILVRYDIAKAKRTLTHDALAKREQTLWRYRELLPYSHTTNSPVSLGESLTPLIRAINLETKLGGGPIYVKDEGRCLKRANEPFLTIIVSRR
jgi:threonine synthase